MGIFELTSPSASPRVVATIRATSPSSQSVSYTNMKQVNSVNLPSKSSPAMDAKSYATAVSKGQVVGDKSVMPCFNQVATGTCAFGRHCLFLHDKRAFIQDVPLRRMTEQQLNAILHYYRPLTHSSTHKRRGGGDDFDYQQQQDMSVNTDGDSVSSNNSAEQCYECGPWKKSSKAYAFKRDVFYYPCVPMSHAAPVSNREHDQSSRNTGYYNPRIAPDNVEEVSMWQHVLSLDPTNHVLFKRDLHDVNRKSGIITGKSRLSVFQQLSQGKSTQTRRG